MTSPNSLYTLIGGEEGIKRLVNAYLLALTTDPLARELRNAYPEDLSIYEARMFEFLSMWLGGPALYQERHGMPMLREMHRNMSITTTLRDQWMYCLRKALNDTVAEEELRLELESRFWKMADSITRR